MRLLSLLTFLALAPSLTACQHSALGQLQRENDEAELRIVQKEQELAYWDDQNRALKQNSNRLLIELKDKRMTSSELNSKLGALRSENARILTYNDQQRAEKLAVEDRIANYQNEIMSLQQNDNLNAAQKKKRIAELQTQIRHYLEIITKQ